MNYRQHSAIIWDYSESGLEWKLKSFIVGEAILGDIEFEWCVHVFPGGVFAYSVMLTYKIIEE